MVLYRFNRIVTQKQILISFSKTPFSKTNQLPKHISNIYRIELIELQPCSDTTVGFCDTKRSEKLKFYYKPEPRIHAIQLID